MKEFEIEIVTDGGPWATHNMPCAICHKEHAVLDLETAIFYPCWKCQKQWVLKKKNKFLNLFKGLR